MQAVAVTIEFKATKWAGAAHAIMDDELYNLLDDYLGSIDNIPYPSQDSGWCSLASITMASFPIAEAQLVALFMQSVSYGIHVVTFVICIWTLWNKLTNGRASMYWPWLSIAVILFIIGTIDLIFNLYHNLLAFIIYGDAQEVFTDLSSWVNIIRSVWFYLGGVISDAALMYRCWLICDRRWPLLVLPVLLWLAAIGCSGTQIYYMSTLEAMSTIPDESKIHPFIMAYYATTLATNMACTSMIVHRIWKVNRRSAEFFTQSWSGSGRVNLAGLNRIFIESAFLYTTSVAATYIATPFKSNSIYGVSDVSLELAGISFDLIIIRIGRGIATEQTQAYHDTFRAPVQEISINDTSEHRTGFSGPRFTHSDIPTIVGGHEASVVEGTELEKARDLWDVDAEGQVDNQLR